jgi:transcriptional regulator with XRE-family HTH domain
MEPDRAAALGQHLRTRREELGLSTRQLSAQAGVNDVTIVRIERGEFAAPRPDKLSRLADALAGQHPAEPLRATCLASFVEFTEA